MNVVLIIIILCVILLIGYFSYRLGDVVYRIEELERYVYVDLISLIEIFKGGDYNETR